MKMTEKCLFMMGGSLLTILWIKMVPNLMESMNKMGRDAKKKMTELGKNQ